MTSSCKTDEMSVSEAHSLVSGRQDAKLTLHFIAEMEIWMALAFIMGLVAYQQVVGIRGYLIGSLRAGCNIDFAFH